MMVVMFMLMLMIVSMAMFMVVSVTVCVVIAVVVMAVMGLVMGCLMDCPVDRIRPVPQSHVMAVFFLAVDGDVHVGAADTAGHCGPGGHLHSGDQVIHGVQESLFVLQQFIQGGHQHVACGTHIALQIQCFHFSALSI